MAGLRPADVGRLVTVGDPRVSPDGEQVAFAVVHVDVEANEYRSRIWLGPLDGSMAPRPFTSGAGRDGRPRWAPDGWVLAFTSHRDDEGCTLHAIPLGAGEVSTVVTWPEEIEEVAWSPDGTHLAFLARRRDERQYASAKAKDQPARRVGHLFARVDGAGWTFDRKRRLFVVPVDGSASPRQVLDGDYEETGFAWSPDGTRFAFTSARHPDWDLDWAVDLWVVDAAGGEPRRLTDTVLSCSAPSWSPDGERIAFLAYDPRLGAANSHVGVAEVAGGEVTMLTAELDRNCAPPSGHREPVWDGDDVLFLLEDRGNAHLYRNTEPVVAGERVVTGFDARGGAIAYCATTATEQVELFSDERRLTTIGRALTQEVALSEPERFTATSADGTQVDAWVMRPVGAVAGERHPTLLNIHGGPFTQYGNRFFDEFQVQAGAGYAVVYANPRGSAGYGDAWAHAIRGPKAEPFPGSGWGSVDFEDLIAVIDEAVARFDFVDPGRLGVLGGSYGGYMTTWIVGHDHRFKAACSERAVNNLLNSEHASDIASWFRRWVGPTHLDDPEEYLRQSPITYVRDIDTPMLILHSEEDYRCPISQAEELWVALRALGKPVEFVRFPGEGHELSRSGSPKHRIERLEIILDWFGRHL
ncbi:MAG TPA: S9 family peptidase [Acidimicrobiales bacterium]|nr:S9 family peptidase [Acidimicrobiales bacterium]